MWEWLIFVYLIFAAHLCFYAFSVLYLGRAYDSSTNPSPRSHSFPAAQFNTPSKAPNLFCKPHFPLCLRPLRLYW